MTNQATTSKAQNPRPESARARKTRQMAEFALHLIGSPNAGTAAQLVGISRGQATRWLRSEAFLEAYRNAHRPDNGAIESLARAMVIPALKSAALIIEDKNA